MKLKKGKNIWEVFIENGREPTGINVYNWVEKLNSIGCGEILITSIDQEGTGKGFDIDLSKNISNIANCPVISSGGAGDILHIKNIKTQTKISGVALSKFLHIQGNNISDIKKQLNYHDCYNRLWFWKQKSLSLALKEIGVPFKVTDKINDIDEASHIIFPGVGDFGSAISSLKKKKNIQLLKKSK